MGKVVYSMSVSLDGFAAAPDGSLDWVMMDDELHAYFNDQARAHGAFLYGRRLYELMTAYWPTADEHPDVTPVEADFASVWRAKPKVVFSTTLERVEWNSRLARDGLAEEIAGLKAEFAGDLDVGGPTLAASLGRLDLIDEYIPCVHPVILGEGQPFLRAPRAAADLRLIDTRTFGSGVVALRYERARPA